MIFSPSDLVCGIGRPLVSGSDKQTAVVMNAAALNITSGILLHIRSCNILKINIIFSRSIDTEIIIITFHMSLKANKSELVTRLHIIPS